MKTQIYTRPMCQTLKVRIEQPLAFSADVDDDTIGGGGGAGDNGNPPMDAPSYQDWTDIWNENNNNI